MKIQEIRRNGNKYYHIYLPKNIIENVLHWKGRDNLVYRVVNETLVLNKESSPSNEWLTRICCKVCYTPTIIIKIIKNSLRRQYIIVARCPIDHIISKIVLPASNFHEWKTVIIPQILSCDICNGKLIEERRKFVRSNIGFRVHLKLFCRDCGRHRVKVIAQELWDELHLKEYSSPMPQSQSATNTPQKHPLLCPTCEEPIRPDQSFCSQCGSCLIK
ncbi:MAG: hypothetical protein ACTSQI_07835 [Candidatus Helarchaeota archaeon]